MDKFHPDDLKNPVYEHSQVITVHELRAIYANLAQQYNASRWWQFKARMHLTVAGYVVGELLTWLREGKPN